MERRRWRELWFGLGLAAGSVTALLVVGELLVFRFVLVASDVPRNVFVAGIVRSEPAQRGVWRVRSEIAAPFAINAQGWNSVHPQYVVPRRDGVRRMAIVGDSYVEALQVPVDRSLAEDLERRLAGAVEVLRFGLSGAPLSQYLWVLEHEVAAYRPDVAVVVLVHNDFEESFRYHPGRYTSSFMKLRLENGRVLDEIPPTPYVADWRDALRQTRTLRYLYFRQQVSVAALRRLVVTPRAAQANVDLADMRASLDDVRTATDYLFARLAEVARASRMRLVLLMDGDRQAIYRGSEDENGPLALNRLAAEMAARHGLDFVDLHGWFARDWALHGRRFEFAADAHWNERGHRIAARALRALLETDVSG